MLLKHCLPLHSDFFSCFSFLWKDSDKHVVVFFIYLLLHCRITCFHLDRLLADVFIFNQFYNFKLTNLNSSIMWQHISQCAGLQQPCDQSESLYSCCVLWLFWRIQGEACSELTTQSKILSWHHHRGFTVDTKNPSWCGTACPSPELTVESHCFIQPLNLYFLWALLLVFYPQGVNPSSCKIRPSFWEGLSTCKVAVQDIKAQVCCSV